MRPDVYPITQKQRFVLRRDTLPEYSNDPRGSWINANATLVHPRVDLRRLRRAFQKLCERHDSLRTHFEPHKDSWQAVIERRIEAPVQEIELGDVDDATFHKRIVEIANAPLPLVARPQIEMILVRCGARGDVVVFRVNHIVADGFSMMVLTEDLLKLLIGMPIGTRALSYPEYLAQFASPPPGRAAAFEAFWQEMFRDPPQAPNIGRKAKGLEPNLYNLGPVENRRLSLLASASDVERLQARAARNNTSFATMLFAGYLEALCQNYDTDQLLFSTSVSRANPALARYVGDHTQVPILRYRAAGAARMDHAAGTVRANLMAAMDHLPHTSAWRESQYEEQLIADGAHPRQFQCNQPQAVTEQNRSIFRHGMKKAHGEETRFGPFGLSSIDVSIFRWNWFDLQFRTREAPGASGFHLAYDGVSYTETEIRLLAEKICELLDLRPVEVSVG